MAKKIIKGKIGNAITSVAEDHIVVVSEDVFDEKHQKYQSEINDIAIGGTKWEGEYEGGTKVLFDRLKSNLAQCINDGTIYFVTDSNGNFTQIALGDGSKSHVVGIGPKMDDTTKQELMSKLGLTISSDMGTIQLGKLANHNGVSSQKVVTYERTGLGTDTHEISTVGYVQQYMKTAQAMVYAGVFNAQTKEITDYNNAIISPSEEGNVTFDYLLNGYEGETLFTPGMSFIVGTAGDLEGYTGINVYGGQTNVEVGDMIIIINVQPKESVEGGSMYNEASILIIQNTNLKISDGAITTAKIADAAVTTSKLSTDIQSLISNLSKTATFAGIATPTTNPGTPDGSVFYIAKGKGTYTNFGGIDVTEDEVVVLYYDTVWHKNATGIASNDKLTELEGNNIPLHISLPMISKKSNLQTATLGTRIFTPETISAFLLDMKLTGTPETGCTYDLEFQYAKTGTSNYFNYLYLFKNSGDTRSEIGAYTVGSNAPTGVKVFEFTTTDSHVTKCSVVLDYRALLDVVEKQGTYAHVKLASDWGYQFNQTYLFDTDDKNSILYYLQHIDASPMNIPIENVDTSIWEGTPAVATYPDAIKELFVSPAFLNGVTRLTTQRYESQFYLTALINNTVVFAVHNDMSSWQNNIAYPLKVKTAGENANVGDIVGYVVFSDVSKFTHTTSASNLRINVVKSISAFGSRSDNFVSTFLMQHPEVSANERSWGQYGFPMLVKTSKLEDIIDNTNIGGATISSLMFSQFLLDMKLVGTREPNAQYRFARFQHRSNAGGPSYANFILIDKSTDNWTTETHIAQHYVGSTPPSGTNIIELDTTDSYITKVKLLMNWDVLKDINVFTEEKYARYDVPKSYVFDTEYMLNQDLGIIPNIESHKALEDDEAYGLEIQLPNVIYSVVGTELNLWNDAIAYSMDKGLQSPMNYSVNWYSNVGIVTNRCYRFTPVAENAGNTYSLTCYLYNVNGKQVATKTVQIKVLAKNALATAKNIVYFGDSLGASAASALYDNFNNADKFTGTKPTMLGTRGTTCHYEAVGGYRWVDYATQGRRAFRCYVSGLSSTITLQAQYTNNGFTWRIAEVNITEGSGNILITKDDIGGTDSPETNGTLISTTGAESIPYTNATLEGANPLWNPNTQQIDVAYYKQRIGLSAEQKIDAVSFQFGINDSSLADDLTTLYGYIQTLYNAFIADNPDCLFIIGLTTTSGNDANGSGANYGASTQPIPYNDRVYRIRRYYLTLQGDTSMPNIRIAPIHPQVDRYYGYAFGTRPISQRYTQTEQYHTNYVHPGASGYGQMGDAYFAAFIGALVF